MTDDRIGRPRSGHQYELRGDGYAATISSIGATLRVLQCGRVDLIVPFDADEVRPAMQGALLAPWPNRTADGRYDFAGVTHQLTRNEFETANAAHGLVAWLDFRCTEQSAERVTLTAAIEPQPGYPWRVRLDVFFELTADGLTQKILATNESMDAAPFGVAGHPYLLAGPPVAGAIDECVLSLPADEVLSVSPDRLLPIALADVGRHDGGRLDFRQPRRIADTEINHAFTSLQRDADGRARVRLTSPGGSGVEISWDGQCRWVQVYTADAAATDRHRLGLAVEPMTCPPDAFNSKRDLIVIEPGASTRAEWRIRSI